MSKGPEILVKGSWADDFKVRVKVPRSQDLGAIRAADQRAVRASHRKRAMLSREQRERAKAALGVTQMEFLGAVPLNTFFGLQTQLGKADFNGDRTEILTRLELIAKPR